ncbi:MAG: mandelate racemase/muconate lactonizing enzyme family protein [Candidatus Bathyarchaeia archaeon]
MKIADVRVRRFRFPPSTVLRKPFFNSILYNRPSRERGASITQITTDEGITGFWPGGNKEIIEGRIKPKLLGENPLNLERLWQRMYMGGDRKPVAKGDYISVMSHVDNALWDLAGKILGQPVYRLLGGYTNRVRVYAAGGYYAEGKSIEGLVKELESNVAEGFTAVKMKVGAWRFGVTMETDVARVKAAREALGDEVDIMVDANNAWNAYEAKRFAKLVEPYQPFWLEEPVEPDDLDGSLELKGSTVIPIASGENEFTRYGFRDLIAKRAVDIIQADPNIAGGLTEIRKIAALADAYHIRFAPHGGHIVGSHAVAAFPNGLIVEHYGGRASPYRDPDPPPSLYQDPLQVKDGYIEIPERPGFGMEIDERNAEKYEVKEP